MLQGPYVPLSTSTPAHVLQGNQQIVDSAQEESFQNVLPSISQQSLYPSLAAMISSLNTAVSPSIPLSRRVINDIEKYQRTALNSTVQGTIRLTNTSPIFDLDDEEVITLSQNLQGEIAQVNT